MIKIINSIFQLLLNSIFPFSKEDVILFSYSPKQALLTLTKSSKSPVLNTKSIFSYKDELVKRLIWNIKYKKSKKAIEIGGYALFQKLNDYFLSDKQKVVLIPIPITSKRRKERGFNQCELLIKEVKKFDLDDQIIIENNLLGRIIHRDRQTLKNRKERLIDSKDVFVVNKETLKEIQLKLEKENTSIVIVDDVITTGSTIREAIDSLKKAGINKVYGLSLAH